MFVESSTVLPSRNSFPMGWWVKNKIQVHLPRWLFQKDRLKSRDAGTACLKQIVESEKWREFCESSPHAPCRLLLTIVSFPQVGRLVTARAWIPSFYEPISIISKADHDHVDELTFKNGSSQFEKINIGSCNS